MIRGLFSVIIPVYNGSRVIEKTIRSVLDQTYKKLEVIVVDDGSTDGSLEIIRSLEKKYPEIKVHSIENSGQPAPPRNYGIRKSKGEFICFLDQDDRWRPKKLETQMKAFRDKEVAVCYSDAYVHDTREKNADFHYSSHMISMPSDEVFGELIKENFIPMCTAAVRKSWIDTVGPINEKMPGVDDYHLWLRISMMNGKFLYIDSLLADYFLSNTNLSHRQELMTKSLLNCYEDILDRFPERSSLILPRIENTKKDLCDFYISFLQKQQGSLSDKILTAKKAYAYSTTFRYKIRIARWLIRSF